MAEVELAVLLGEYAIGLGALIYGVIHRKPVGGGTTTPQQSHSEDVPPDEDPGSGIAPDDPAEQPGGITPGTEVPFTPHGVMHNTHQNLWSLEQDRHFAVLRRFFSKLRYFWPSMTVATIIALARRYHISMKMQEARALRRAVKAMQAGRDIPPDTPVAIRRLIATSGDPRLFAARRLYLKRKRMSGFETP